MKLLETRQVFEEVCLMSWSPRMDLIALGTPKGEIILHRLSWQKVWQVKLPGKSGEEEKTVVPNIMTWHPDGILIAIAAGSRTYVVDVESGKIIHNHEMEKKITAMKWCPSDYELSMAEVLATQARQQSDFLRNELKIQRLELCLSALIIGTEDGQVQVFTGGFLFALVLKIPSEATKCELVHVDATRNLQSFQFLATLTDDSGSYLCLSHFKTDQFKRVSSTVGPLGFKYLFFIKNWELIQSELNSLNDQWIKLVEIYNGYMTYGADKDLPEVRADYMELLFTGISTVELEIFLGKVGREKEIKKHTNAINSINSSITEHLRSIKCALVLLLTELNEIGGFLKLSRVEEAKSIVSDLRKAFNYLYVAALHIQSLVQNIVDVFLHFFHLLLNTIHNYNIQEVPDFIEEDSEVEKVLEYLDVKIENNIFDFLITNAPLKFKDPPPCLEPVEMPASASKKLAAEKKDPQFPFSIPSADQKWKSFTSFMQSYLEEHKNGFVGQNLILDFSQDEVLKLLSNTNLSPTVNEMLDKLLKIPALSTIPFRAKTYPIAMIPERETSKKDIRSISGLRIKQNSSSTYIYFNWDARTTYLFEFNFSDTNNPLVRSYSLNYSKKTICCDLFSDNYLSVVCVTEDYDGKGKDRDQSQQQEAYNPRGLIFQLHLDKIDENNSIGIPVDLNKFKSGSKQKLSQSVIPGDVTVDVPNGTGTGSSGPGPGSGSADQSSSGKSSGNTDSNHIIESSIFVDGFLPEMMAVSGARKLGALLSESRKVVVLIDMEQESSDNSYDEETTAEFSSETLSEVSL